MSTVLFSSLTAVLAVWGLVDVLAYQVLWSWWVDLVARWRGPALEPVARVPTGDFEDGVLTGTSDGAVVRVRRRHPVAGWYYPVVLRIVHRPVPGGFERTVTWGIPTVPWILVAAPGLLGLLSGAWAFGAFGIGAAATMIGFAWVRSEETLEELFGAYEAGMAPGIGE